MAKGYWKVYIQPGWDLGSQQGDSALPTMPAAPHTSSPASSATTNWCPAPQESQLPLKDAQKAAKLLLLLIGLSSL